MEAFSDLFSIVLHISEYYLLWYGYLTDIDSLIIVFDTACCELHRIHATGYEQHCINITCHEVHRINTTCYEVKRINTICYEASRRNIIGHRWAKKFVQLATLRRQVESLAFTDIRISTSPFATCRPPATSCTPSVCPLLGTLPTSGGKLHLWNLPTTGHRWMENRCNLPPSGGKLLPWHLPTIGNRWLDIPRLSDTK